MPGFLTPQVLEGYSLGRGAMKRIILFVLIIFAVFGSCKNSTPTTPTLPVVAKVYPKIDGFTASRMDIFPNSAVTLSWSTRDATRIIITPMIGDVAASGTKQVTLSETTTFTLTAENNDGAVTQQVQVKVDLQDPCKTMAISYYFAYSIYFHVETPTNTSSYDVANVEITVTLFDANNNVMDWGKGTIPIIRMNEKGTIDIFLQYGKGLLHHHSTVAVTNCNAMTSQFTRQVKEKKIR
jgi:hypothetical protein